MNDPKKLIKEAIKAVSKELAAVREQPSREVLSNGEEISDKKFGDDCYYYRFPTKNKSIQYAETVEVTKGENSCKAKPVEFDEKGITLSFEEKLAGEPDQIEVEWINDFVLRRLTDELEFLLDADNSKIDNIKALFAPRCRKEAKEVTVSDDKQRNASQHAAIKKALRNRTLFIWGPPGTGKTSTLGYIIANYLAADKKVLFASNTNRAVDIGMISTLKALQNLGNNLQNYPVTRYGDVILESKSLQDIHFEKIMERKKEKRKREAAELKALVQNYQQTFTEIEAFEEKGGEIPDELATRRKLLEQKVARLGGKDAILSDIEMNNFWSERAELKKFQLIGTTLAKVCTSELFTSLDFDAVVIDEASMANLPYLMVLAAKARQHIVTVGDPMQLPPIALTSNRRAKKHLEQDIFTYVSGASSTEELFAWHDKNPEITAFFEVQYRLKSELANLVSSVFYQNRLKTAEPSDQKESDQTVFLLNTERLNPSLTQSRESRRYRPRNEVHLNILKKLVYKLVMSELIPADEIGIIVPFRSCVYDVRDLVRSMGFPGVETGTIHTYQGREKRVIIFDTVMTGEKQGHGFRHYSVRPFDEAKNGLSVHRLLNVAFSRSKSHLYVLADMNHIRQIYESKFLGRLLKTMALESEAITL